MPKGERVSRISSRLFLGTANRNIPILSPFSPWVKSRNRCLRGEKECASGFHTPGPATDYLQRPEAKRARCQSPDPPKGRDKTGLGPDRSGAKVNGSLLPEPADGRRDPPQAGFLSSPPRPKKHETSPCACARERDGPASRRGRRFSKNRRATKPETSEGKSFSPSAI